jgi:hypothetical protein
MRKLKLNEMKKISGGASNRAMYCATMHMIINNNELSDGAWLGWTMGWSAARCNEYSYEYLYSLMPW